MRDEEKLENYELAKKLISEQNFAAAVIAGAVATVYTIAGCLLGNLFRVIMEQVRGTGTSPIDLVGNNSLSTLAEWSVSYVSDDIIYWFVAVVAAVFLAKRPLSRAQRLAIGMLELKT